MFVWVIQTCIETNSFGSDKAGILTQTHIVVFFLYLHGNTIFTQSLSITMSTIKILLYQALIDGFEIFLIKGALFDSWYF